MHSLPLRPSPSPYKRVCQQQAEGAYSPQTGNPVCFVEWKLVDARVELSVPNQLSVFVVGIIEQRLLICGKVHLDCHNSSDECSGSLVREIYIILYYHNQNLHWHPKFSHLSLVCICRKCANATALHNCITMHILKQILYISKTKQRKYCTLIQVDIIS